jgi:hypothetical protein
MKEDEERWVGGSRGDDVWLNFYGYFIVCLTYHEKLRCIHWGYGDSISFL